MRSAISAVAPCLLAYPTRIDISIASGSSVAPLDRGNTGSKVPPRDGAGLRARDGVRSWPNGQTSGGRHLGKPQGVSVVKAGGGRLTHDVVHNVDPMTSSAYRLLLSLTFNRPYSGTANGTVGDSIS